ncbi:hypothetical protein Aduo_006342 [Ancylostoma duodenale]
MEQMEDQSAACTKRGLWMSCRTFSAVLDYLYTQAVAKEGQHHKEALENARTAMLTYEHITRKNFLARDKDLLMDSAHLTSSKMAEEVEKLGSSSLFEYFRPLFGEEWIHGRRKVTIRCEPCYEAYRGTNPTLIPAIAKESGIPLDENTVKVLRNHVRPSMHKSCANVHHQSIATYEERTKKRVNDFLTAVDIRINDPIAATTRLFFLAYTATKMYLPPRQFPTLCDAAAALGMEIEKKKHRTRKAYVSMTTIIGSAMEEQLINYIKIKQPPFSLLLDSSTDHGGKKIMLAYVRFADRISLHPTTHFLEAFEMHEAETGGNIFLKLYSFFKEMRLIRELNWNLFAVATDGASNMIADGGLQGILNRNISRARIRDLTESQARTSRIAAVPDKPLI